MIVAVYLLIVGGIVCALWALMPEPSVSWPRLQTIVDSTVSPWRSPVPRLTSPWPDRFRSVLALMGRLLGRLIPRLSRRRDAVGGRLVATGMPLPQEQIVGIKALSALGCAVVAFTIAREVGPVPPFIVALAGVFGVILPDLWLKGRVRRRQRAIVRLLPEVIDLLSLCIGAGLDFLGALNKVVLVRPFQKEPLIEELLVVLQEIKLGKRRFEALRSAAKRLNVPEVSSFVRTLVQADRMGTPIAEVLSIHSEDIRFERFMRAERAALKAPIKILIPLICCIMPCVALIVGAPIFLQFMRQNPFGK
ncbi:MAG: type II secretion system F family protein [Candidatus Omnitrophica bacterium]|nr:type II secretion system F family protein [Candidatus Omnitrophota bacterium]MBI3020769.1 type II secretion system F family protein [Candidatus Omnitrophota bacterium]